MTAQREMSTKTNSYPVARQFFDHSILAVQHKVTRPVDSDDMFHTCPYRILHLQSGISDAIQSRHLLRRLSYRRRDRRRHQPWIFHSTEFFVAPLCSRPVSILSTIRGVRWTPSPPSLSHHPLHPFNGNTIETQTSHTYNLLSHSEDEKKTRIFLLYFHFF